MTRPVGLPQPGEPAYTAAVFDMDGLLIDSERAIMRAWCEAAAAYGRALAPVDYAQVIGRAAPESDRILAALLGGREAFEAVREHAVARLAHDHAEQAFALKHGAAELLARLHARGVRCAVASSSSVHEIEHRLGRVGVRLLFESVSGGDEVPRGKPDPALYRLAASRLGVPAHRCLAFEDSENGVRAALAAGLGVVAVPDLRPLPAEVTARCRRVLDSLADALDVVPAWFGGP